MSEPPIDPPVEEEIIEGWSTAPVTGDRIDVNENSFTAGDPSGARIEIRSTGFHAFNGVGTETAHIDGAEGVFVGGEFRTSDALPGQVTLSDTGFTHSGTGVSRPGIRIDPEDSTGLAAPAGIGPVDGGFEIDGGRSTSGERTSITMSPGYSLIRADGVLAGTGTSDISVQPSQAEVVALEGAHRGSIKAVPGEVILSATHPSGANAALVRASSTLGANISSFRADGSRAGTVEVSETGAMSRSFSGNASESGWVRARPQDAELAYVDPSNVYASRIKADASEAFLYTSAGGTQRYLTVDATGIWVKTGAKSYNLEETAQDSGWIPLAAPANVTASSDFALRNKGGVIWFRGRVTPAVEWAVGWNVIATINDASFRPSSTTPMREGSNTSGLVLLRVTSAGEVAVYVPSEVTPRTGTYYTSAMTYPAG